MNTTVDWRILAMYVGSFLPVGIVCGLVGFVSVRWAESVYISEASGDIVQTLGPVFSGLVVLQNTIMMQFLSLVLVFVFGFLFGSKQLTTRDGAVIGGAGGLVGHISLMVPAVLLLVVAPVDSQAFALPSMLPLAVTALVVSGLVGAVGGYIGAEAA